MSANSECCSFCRASTSFFSKLEDNADYVVNIDNAFKKHLPLETTKSVNWNPVGGRYKLCKLCFDKADELTKLSSVLEKVHYEISEVVRQISLRITEGRTILDSQTSNIVQTSPSLVDIADQEENYARPRKQKLSLSSVNDNFTLDYESNKSTVGVDPPNTRSKSKKIKFNQVNIGKNNETISQSVPKVVHKISTKIFNSAGTCFYLCETCDINFKDGEELLKHIRFDDAVKLLGRHKCSKCPLSFTFISNLDIHLKSHETLKEMPFKCNLCDLTFNMSHALKTHQLQNHPHEVFLQCEFCLTPMNSLAMMSKHTILHDKLNPMKCYLCPDEMLSSPLHFQQHIQQHKDGKVIQGCHVKSGKYKRQHINSNNKSASGNKANDSNSLQTHSKELFRLLKEGKKNSDIAGKISFPSSTGRVQPHSSSYNFYDVVQSQIQSTVKNMFSTEADLPQDINNETNKKVWCDKCLGNFGDDNDFDNHLVHETNKCFFCRVDFFSACQMIRHYSYAHNGEILPIYRCHKCRRNFKTDRLLLRHQDQNPLCKEALEMAGGGAEPVSSVIIDDEKKPVCFETYEETPVQMDALESCHIDTESFSANENGNENYFEIKAEPGTLDTFYEEVDT